jgi:hypothetical protein
MSSCERRGHGGIEPAVKRNLPATAVHLWKSDRLMVALLLVSLFVVAIFAELLSTNLQYPVVLVWGMFVCLPILYRRRSVRGKHSRS